MGKPTGFIEYLRELPVDRAPLERVRDWNEFHHHMDEKRLRQQGARCMDCGVPFCHTGKLISGMASRLPDQQPDPGVERPRLPRPVARGARSAAQDQQLPRVHRPRLPGAVRRLVRARHQRPPVTIKNIESAIIDRGLEEGWVVPEPPRDAHRQESRGRRLRPRRARRRRAAQQGRPHRHRVRARRPPRRPADVRHPEHEARQARSRRAPHQAAGAGRHQVRLQRERRRERRAAAAAARTSTPSSSAPAPRSRATCPSKAAISRASTSRWSSSPRTPRRCSNGGAGSHADSRAKDKDVVVIGGGDTGTDCVGTSMRHGCKQPRAARDPAEAADGSRRRTIRGRSGPRSTSWTTARKKPRRSSAPTRACT